METKLTEKKVMEPFLNLFSVGNFEEFKNYVDDAYKVDDKINIKKIIDDYFSDTNGLDDKTAENLLELKRLALNNITQDDAVLLEQTLQELQQS